MSKNTFCVKSYLKISNSYFNLNCPSYFLHIFCLPYLTANLQRSDIQCILHILKYETWFNVASLIQSVSWGPRYLEEGWTCWRSFTSRRHLLMSDHYQVLLASSGYIDLSRSSTYISCHLQHRPHLNGAIPRSCDEKLQRIEEGDGSDFSRMKHLQLRHQVGFVKVKNKHVLLNSREKPLGMTRCAFQGEQFELTVLFDAFNDRFSRQKMPVAVTEHPSSNLTRF